MRHQIDKVIEILSSQAIAVSRAIYSSPELADEEIFAVKELTTYMQQYGFQTKVGIAGLKTAFTARWGNFSDAVTIGLLAEYDALPELDQPPTPTYKGNPAKPGHGCGHNLLGTACALAAVVLKQELERLHIPANIILYGCPAEEILKGKIVMAKHGVFSDLDVALSWHPDSVNRSSNTACQAMDSITFSFSGKTAHAAAAPHLGRSALDACELMNVGVNYLREHITDGERIHYAYENTGGKPNVVPEHASLLYFVRGKDRQTVTSTTNRIVKIAQGAALMTETSVDWHFNSRGYEMLVNHTLAELIYQIMQNTPCPTYTEKEYEFAKILSQNVGCKANFYEGIEPYTFGQTKKAFGSTDFSDVSQLVPSAAFRTVCAPVGTPLHHWAMTACSGSSIGEKGMVYAAKIMALTAWEIITDQSLLEKIKTEFQETSKGWWK